MLRAFDRQILRKRITKTRESHEMNQAELAKKADVTPAAISQIEKGSRVPTIPVIHRIANVLSVSLDYLTGKTDTSELQDLLQQDDFVAFFRGFESLGSEDKETIKKHIDFLKSQYEGRKESGATR